MLNGGGGIRGSLLRGGLLDEVSPLVAPAADGRLGTPTVFDVVGEGSAPRRLALKDVERCADDVLWPRCRLALGFPWGSLYAGYGRARRPPSGCGRRAQSAVAERIAAAVRAT